jgi:hypothetical protein
MINTLIAKATGRKQRFIHELVRYWFSVFYLAIVFGFFYNYRRLILAHYNVSYQGYGVAVLKALVLAKVIMISESLRLGRGFEKNPLIVPTLYKSFLFTVCVAIFDAFESIFGSFIHGRNLTEAIVELVSGYNYEWLSGALVVFFAFLPYFAVRELRMVLGDGVVFQLFFRKDRPWNLPLTKKAGE